MSTFDILESSIESSRPIEVYQIVVGSTVYRYTSAEDELSIAGDDYIPEAIGRSKIEQGSDQENRTITITVPSGNDFAARYKTVPPGDRAELTIMRYQRDESPSFNTTVLLFSGIVQSVKFPANGQIAEISVRSIETAVARNTPRFTFMGMCNHFLYDENCGVDPTGFNHIGTVTAVNQNVITVGGLAASGRDCVGGYCKPTGENDFRLVLAQSGDDLTLMIPFAGDVVGASMQCFDGCDHLLLGDCALKFDNVANFGGFAFVPTDNIFETGLKV